jgi:hypothetical protein
MREDKLEEKDKWSGMRESDVVGLTDVRAAGID